MSTVVSAGTAVTMLRPTGEVLNEESLRTVMRVLNAPGSCVIHLDLGEVRLPTAEGLGLLVSLNRGLCDRGGHLALLNVDPLVYEVFSITRLTEVLDVRPA
jgi:anti-anti-sigma factor